MYSYDFFTINKSEQTCIQTEFRNHLKYFSFTFRPLKSSHLAMMFCTRQKCLDKLMTHCSSEHNVICVLHALFGNISGIHSWIDLPWQPLTQLAGWMHQYTVGSGSGALLWKNEATPMLSRKYKCFHLITPMHHMACKHKQRDVTLKDILILLTALLRCATNMYFIKNGFRARKLN